MSSLANQILHQLRTRLRAGQPSIAIGTGTGSPDTGTGTGASTSTSTSTPAATATATAARTSTAAGAHRTPGTFIGAVLPICSVEVLIVVVRPWVLADIHEANLYVVAFHERFRRTIVLMAQGPDGASRFYGPTDILRVLQGLPFEMIPWRRLLYRVAPPPSWRLPVPQPRRDGGGSSSERADSPAISHSADGASSANPTNPVSSVSSASSANPTRSARSAGSARSASDSARSAGSAAAAAGRTVNGRAGRADRTDHPGRAGTTRRTTAH